MRPGRVRQPGPAVGDPERALSGRRRIPRAAGAALAGAAVATSLAAACGPPAPGSAAAPGPPLSAATIATLPAPNGTPAALAEARKFVFRVRNVSCLATGTAFAYGGAIVTNRHVAAGADRLELSTWDGTDFDAGVDGHADGADLARLGAVLPSGTAPAATTAGLADPGVGAEVFVAGYPEGDQLTAVGGSVVGVTTDPSSGVSGPILEITNRILPGNSGSPLLDDRGRVVGVVFAFDTATGDGLAMPLRTLSAFLAGRPDGAPLPCTS